MIIVVYRIKITNYMTYSKQKVPLSKEGIKIFGFTLLQVTRGQLIGKSILDLRSSKPIDEK